MPLRVRINDLDSYQLTPTHLDQFQRVPKVPIIRVYGCTRPNTLEVCYNVLVHVHNFYPYFYIDCPEYDISRVDDKYLNGLTSFLDGCLSESFQRNGAAGEDTDEASEEEIPDNGDDGVNGDIFRNSPQGIQSDVDKNTNKLPNPALNDDTSNRMEVVIDQSISDENHGKSKRFDANAFSFHERTSFPNKFVASVILCRGCAAYGYNVGYSHILKILLFLQNYKARLFRLMTENKIDFLSFSNEKKPSRSALSTPRIYEAHINYYSQFLADFNLYGCGWLDIREMYFRLPLLSSSTKFHGDARIALNELILGNNVLNPKKYPRMGRSALEIDIHVGSILNRANLRQRDVHNDFTEFNNPTPQEHIYLSSLRLTFEDLKFQCESRGRYDTSQILNELYSQVFTKLGQAGYCDWEFTQEHQQQLSYVSKLNKPTNYKSPNLFYKNQLSHKLPSKTLPTTFELVDRTMPLTFYEKVPKLNYRDDLIKWDLYESLFETFFKNSNEQRIQTALSLSNTRDCFNDKPPLVGTRSDEDNEDMLGTLSSPASVAESYREEDIDFAEENQIENKDLHILNQTQCPQSGQYDSMMSSASTLSQTSNYLLRQPKTIFEFALRPNLSKRKFAEMFTKLGILEHNYFDPSYFLKKDMHDRALVFANKKIVVPLRDGSEIPKSKFADLAFEASQQSKKPFFVGKRAWLYSISPPTKSETVKWIDNVDVRLRHKRQKFKTQIEPAFTQTYDFKDSHEPARMRRSPSDFPGLTHLNLELHVNVSTLMQPNPASDEISMIVCSFDDPNTLSNQRTPLLKILLNSNSLSKDLLSKSNIHRLETFLANEVLLFTTEIAMIEQFASLVDYYDPDILSGFEVNSSSWGYLIERFQVAYNMNLLARLGRVDFKGNGKFGDRWGYTHTSVIKVNGRHMLNIWRILRLEVQLTSYSLENVCLHILHHTIPKISFQTLSRWFKSESFGQFLLVCKYYKQRIDVVMRIVEIKELIVKNVELSRLIGIDFYSNFYRGSQFKVESILIRIAKPENLLLNSPSKAQVHNMRPLEVIPLIMEPDSGFYKSPLVVLDFQSLYPSIMIAYNYCYSTFLGKMEGYKAQRNPIGYMKHHSLPDGILELLRQNNGVNISPNGLMFVSAKFRKSILSRMLQEILNMRINVKAVAAAFADEKELQKVYNSKQLALKLIANVTYGYTSASFSGRMPSSDIADAIVATGREIMRRAIEMIDSSEFNAKVVYGDTDSLFVYFPGKSRDTAFSLGNQLAKSITDVFPDPIKLKFEKVYHPCVLLAKKRYVGNCFEHESQKSGQFEAKGIETIRRDGIPAQLKMVGKTLRILFDSKNLSFVKSYVVEQFNKILQNRVNVSDFCFAKEVRYGTYKNEKYLPPGAVIAKRLIKSDPRKEPQYRERIPYVVIRDTLKERIKDRSVTPEEFVNSYRTTTPMELDHEYYITRVIIPPLERIFNLMGVNVKEWFREMPRTTIPTVSRRRDIFNVTENIIYEENADHDEEAQSGCDTDPTAAAQTIWNQKETYRKLRKMSSICESCCFRNLSNSLVILSCKNHDCRIYYSRLKSEMKSSLMDIQVSNLSSEE